MKDLITMPDGTRGYSEIIEGYKFGVVELASGWISFQAPMGEGKDKEMFDKLVYYNKGLYNGKVEDKESIKNRISNWILEYKGQEEFDDMIAGK